MELNEKESMLFGQYICAELQCLADEYDPDVDGPVTSEQYCREEELQSVMNKWAEHQDKAVSITGQEFVLPPAKPCRLTLTEQELNALDGLFCQLKSIKQHPSKKMPEKSPDYLPELTSIIEKIKGLGTRNWLVLIWEYTKDFIFHFTRFTGTKYDVTSYLEHIRTGDIPDGKIPCHEWNTSVTWNADFRNDVVMTYSENNEYIAVPLPKNTQWVFASQHNDERGQDLHFKFDFREHLTDYDARMIVKSIWAGACNGGLDNPAAKIMGTEEGAIYANEYLPGDGPLSIIAFPLTLLDGGGEVTLDMSDLKMSTIDQIDDAMKGIEEAFTAALKGADKSQSFHYWKKVLNELVEVYLIPEVLEH